LNPWIGQVRDSVLSVVTKTIPCENKVYSPKIYWRNGTRQRNELNINDGISKAVGDKRIIN
jgi:hypothetical protein